MTKQKNAGQSKDTRGTIASRSDTGTLEHSRLDTTPTQDADPDWKHAADVGKDGYRDTAGAGTRTRNDDDDEARQRRNAGSVNEPEAGEPRRASGNQDRDESRGNRNDGRDNRRASNKDGGRRGEKQR